MAASRFMLSKTQLFRTVTPAFYLTHLPVQVFHRSCSSAAADITTAADVDNEGPSPSDQCLYHPWPELVAFVNRLKAKGYLHQLAPSLESRDEAQASSSGESSSTAADNIYLNMNLVKNACLCFARDRNDIFKSLSMEHVQTLVKRQCPNLYRKSVLSAKRLRAHVHLDEGDVCASCSLRGSCDRAYLILKESEGAARTVDIVRVMLSYALDPLVITGLVNPPGRLLIESSARKLFSELIELSESLPDPALLNPIAKVSEQKDKAMNLTNGKFSQDVEMKRGDWMCPKCNFMNFARNVRCLNCNEDGPKRTGVSNDEMKKGDWTCPGCNFMNFARNLHCLKCRTKAPKRVNPDDIEMKKGDWNCPECGFMNFANNRKCYRCQELRKIILKPGDWECPSCEFLNYRRNMVCLKCNCEHPKEERTNEHDYGL